MTRPRSAAVAATVFLLVATAAAADARPNQAPGPSHHSGRLLDVPYLPQTPDLCGGAAVAMVLRYWGERQIYPEDFEALVDRSAAGIRTDVLTADVQRRGWQALPFAADALTSGDWMRGHINNGRPVIALIEVSPDRYHYVVIVAWTGERVIAHDPARAPFRVLSGSEFDDAWAAAGRWALLILPSTDRTAARADPGASASPGPSPPSPCGPLVQEMVARAHGGDVTGAEAGLVEATGLCPQLAAAWRELAGVRFVQKRWSEASTLAERASRLDPEDAPGWELLGASRFLNDEPRAALAAWNRIGRPSVDLVRVEGARRTRHPVIAGVIALPPRALLTPERFDRAARRLQEVPSAAVTRLRYRPVEGGLAEVEAALVERPTLPRGIVPVVAAAGRALVQRELRLEAASPTGSGELWTAAWRWWESRPRLAFALAVPSPPGLPGISTVEGIWEQQSYRVPATGLSNGVQVRDDARRRAAYRLSDWATSRLRWEAGVALDRWAGDSHVSIEGALDGRFAGDRFSLVVEAGAWVPSGSGRRFARGALTTAWRSTTESNRRSWSISTGVTTTGSAAPFDLWPGAGAGHARAPLLRAHPLLDDGVITGEVFGRQLANGTVEYQHPVAANAFGVIRLAVFADTARAWRIPGSSGASLWHTDLGAGVRVALPGSTGTARIDVARGLRDGRTVLSAGWQAPWPGR